VLKALQQMTIRAIAAESKNELFEGRLKDKDQVIDAWKGRAEIAEEQLKKSLENRADAGRVFTVDQARVEACQQQLQKADTRIHALEHPGFLRSVFDPRTLSGFMGGYGVRAVQETFKK
jgi:hypothetical protein